MRGLCRFQVLTRLELALKQINDYTDITMSYEKHKKWRVIIGFSFMFKQKKPKIFKIATETDFTK